MVEFDTIPLLEHDVAKGTEVLPSQRTGGIKEKFSFRKKGFREDGKNPFLHKIGLNGLELPGSFSQRIQILGSACAVCKKAGEHYLAEKKDFVHFFFLIQALNYPPIYRDDLTG
jgi:hypothetical protein